MPQSLEQTVQDFKEQAAKRSVLLADLKARLGECMRLEGEVAFYATSGDSKKKAELSELHQTTAQLRAEIAENESALNYLQDQIKRGEEKISLQEIGELEKTIGEKRARRDAIQNEIKQLGEQRRLLELEDGTLDAEIRSLTMQSSKMHVKLGIPAT